MDHEAPEKGVLCYLSIKSRPDQDVQSFVGRTHPSPAYAGSLTRLSLANYAQVCSADCVRQLHAGRWSLGTAANRREDDSGKS